MPKAKKSSASLYELLGVTSTAEVPEIKAAYKRRVLETHPDKLAAASGGQPPDAVHIEKANAAFAAVHKAYEVLSDGARRQKYDESGLTDEESDEFKSAYEYYRSLHRKVTAEDIDAFAAKYRESPAEREEVLNLYRSMEGNVAGLLDRIPVSRPQDVDRYVADIRAAIAAGELSASGAFEKSVKTLRVRAKRIQREMDSFNANAQTAQETDLIQAIQRNRARAQQTFIEDLERKYAPKPKKPKRA